MKNEKISIVFFGSGPVAAASLKLLSKSFMIEAVVTKPTTKRLMGSVVGDRVIHTVSDKKGLDALFTTEKFDSRVGILIDFGIIVSKKIIDYFEKGIINSHFSLLPDLRGADPISFAILNGLQETGVSLMLLVEAMDEGPILATGKLELKGNETGVSLTNHLVKLSETLLKTIVPAYVNNKKDPHSGAIPRPQSQEVLSELLNKNFVPTYTRKLNKSDGDIDWNKSAATIDREIRAFIEWPKSRTTFSGIDCIITDVNIVEKPDSYKPGQLFIRDKQLCVACSDMALQLNLIKPANKKIMSSEAFLAGYKNRLSIKNIIY